MHLPAPTRWRAFAAARYRPFHAIAVGQSFTGSFASDAMFVPLLLGLGAHPAAVMAIGTLPIVGSILQAFLPQMLRRMHGDLRRLTLLFAFAELRGLVLAAIAAGAAAGVYSPDVAIVLVAIAVAVGQSAGLLSASNIGLWAAVILSEEERRLVSPRMGAVSMALSTVILLPAGFVLDAATHRVGLWAYVGFFLVGGLVPIITPLAVSRLPRPGRVAVARPKTTGEPESPALPQSFDRFVRATAIGSFGQGVLPYLAVFAIGILGQSPGFALLLSGVGSAGSLIGSLVAGSFLLRGSASRTLRVSFLARSVAALLCALSLPGNPFAPFQLLLGVALFNSGGNAGALATNERLYRLVSAENRVRAQSLFVGVNSLAIVSGASVSVAALAIAVTPAWVPFVGLYIVSGVSRTLAALSTEVSPTWRSPIVELPAAQPAAMAAARPAASARTAPATATPTATPTTPAVIARPAQIVAASTSSRSASSGASGQPSCGALGRASTRD